MVRVPRNMFDDKGANIYVRESHLGTGAFAKCYKVVEICTNEYYAVKAVSKKLLIREKNKSQMYNEISIHKSLCHKNLVKFYNCFEDGWNVYMILELCPNMSLMDLFLRREILILYEVRYYMYQLIQGVKYLHDNHIIHRDLKLSNLLITENLQLKIGDFGFATRVQYKGQLKRDYCGTLSYMAPEILNRLGHSYEVDIWSIGCIMYTLSYGRHAFDEITVDDTIEKIKNCDYRFPFELKKSATDMIRAMLESSPKKRPKISELLNYKFMNEIKVPESLPALTLNLGTLREVVEQYKIYKRKKAASENNVRAAKLRRLK